MTSTADLDQETANLLGTAVAVVAGRALQDNLQPFATLLHGAARKLGDKGTEIGEHVDAFSAELAALRQAQEASVARMRELEARVDGTLARHGRILDRLQVLLYAVVPLAILTLGATVTSIVLALRG